ncbi:MAG: response regulator transcription factor [Bifidobacteriaceae bacterium]|jgi:NarL family two-component system response regulator YdfI|nr:response regulator transcription factor [Bifidobacteriaceae bacterium]
MTRLLIVDDHPIVRTGLSLIFETIEGFEVVAEADDGAEALGKIEAYRPDIVLSDIRMPGMDGIEMLRKVRATYPDLPVVMLTTFDDQEPVQQAMALGANGFLLKDADKVTIVTALREALAGKVYLDPQIAGKAFQHAPEPERVAVSKDHIFLSAREQQILAAVAQGERNKDIAGLLNVSVRTVKSDLTTIYHKLDVYSRAEAVAVALSKGLIGR